MKFFLKYIKTIVDTIMICMMIGFSFGSIYEYKVTKSSKWQAKKERQQIIFSLLGAIGGLVLGIKLAEEASEENK